ncbi:MAG: RNA polymerase sigma factor [Acidimicrobiia bacterium]
MTQQPPTHPHGTNTRLARLYNEHRAAVIAYCMRRAGREDALDATAETFAVALRRIDDMPRGEAELSWLYAVAYRVLANQRRGNARMGNLKVKLANTETDVGVDPVDQLIRNEEDQQVVDAMAALRPDDRELLQLVTWEEHPRDQIAAMFDISRSTLDQRIHRALKRLKKTYARMNTSSLTPKAAEGEAR